MARVILSVCRPLQDALHKWAPTLILESDKTSQEQHFSGPCMSLTPSGESLSLSLTLSLIYNVHPDPLLQFFFLLPHAPHPSVTTDLLALFCVIALTQASWSAPIMFCLLALPRAHRAVRKSALFLAPIRSYLKSPSQTCDCTGLGWRPPDFQLRQQPVLFRPAAVLNRQQTVPFVVTCQWFSQ